MTKKLTLQQNKKPIQNARNAFKKGDLYYRGQN